MSQMQPAIALLETEAEGLRARLVVLDAEAAELRGRLSGLVAAAAVLRGSAGPGGSGAILLAAPARDEAAETAEEAAGEPEGSGAAADAGPAAPHPEAILAAVGELGPHAFVARLADRLGVPRDGLRQVLAGMEGDGLVRVVPLGPMQGLVERLGGAVAAAGPDGAGAAGEAVEAPAADAKAEMMLRAIAELGPTVSNDQLVDRLGWHRQTVMRHLASLEAAGRIRRTGVTRGRRIEIVEAPAGAGAEGGVGGDVHFSALDRAAENEHGDDAPASAGDPAPAGEPESAAAARVEPPPPVVPVAPARAPARKPKPRPAASAAPAPRSASSRPVAPRPVAADPLVSKFRRPVAADEAEAIARHLAKGPAPKYEAGTMLALLERTFAAAGKTFAYQAGPKSARAPYVVNGRPLTPAKAIAAANEIRAREGLELLAVPGKPGKAGRR